VLGAGGVCAAGREGWRGEVFVHNVAVNEASMDDVAGALKYVNFILLRLRKKLDTSSVNSSAVSSSWLDGASGAVLVLSNRLGEGEMLGKLPGSSDFARGLDRSSVLVFGRRRWLPDIPRVLRLDCLLVVDPLCSPCLSSGVSMGLSPEASVGVT
jgi:hypothetical protein